MYTQVIILGNVYYCIVFEVVDHEPHIIDKYSTQVFADLREWLAQNEYPKPSEMLCERDGGNLAHGFYIKPHITDLYFRVHEDNLKEPVDSDQFDEPLGSPEGF